MRLPAHPLWVNGQNARATALFSEPIVVSVLAGQSFKDLEVHPGRRYIRQFPRTAVGVNENDFSGAHLITGTHAFEPHLTESQSRHPQIIRTVATGGAAVARSRIQAAEEVAVLPKYIFDVIPDVSRCNGQIRTCGVRLQDVIARPPPDQS